MTSEGLSRSPGIASFRVQSCQIVNSFEREFFGVDGSHRVMKGNALLTSAAQWVESRML